MGDVLFDREYRGIRLRAGQSQKRIELVKAAIEAVFALGTNDLIRYAGDRSKPPEARLLAGAKLEAMFQSAVEERRARPGDIDIDYVRALTAEIGTVWEEVMSEVPPDDA